MKTQLWSCGGGTQSAAIAALIVSGRLPKPDLAVIVDTEREKSSTWRYYEDVLKPELANVGVDLIRVPKSEYAHWDLYKSGEYLVIPAYTNQNGKEGKLQTFCSNEWKLRVVMRWAKAQGVDACECWMGMSTDELRRVRVSKVGWFQYRYVLLEDGIRMNRADCQRLPGTLGWPDPPRSACWMCPQMQNPEWRELRDHAPEDFARAVAFDQELRVIDPNVFLHRECKPLAEINLDADPSSTPSLFEAGCTSGMCWN